MLGGVRLVVPASLRGGNVKALSLITLALPNHLEDHIDNHWASYTFVSSVLNSSHCGRAARCQIIKVCGILLSTLFIQINRVVAVP